MIHLMKKVGEFNLIKCFRKCLKLSRLSHFQLKSRVPGIYFRLTSVSVSVCAFEESSIAYSSSCSGKSSSSNRCSG